LPTWPVCWRQFLWLIYFTRDRLGENPEREVAGFIAELLWGVKSGKEKVRRNVRRLVETLSIAPGFSQGEGSF